MTIFLQATFQRFLFYWVIMSVFLKYMYWIHIQGNGQLLILQIQGHQYLSLQLKVVITKKWNKIVNFCKCIYVESGLERQFSKYHSICPPSASITSWGRLEKVLHESQRTFWGILAHSYSLTFRASKLSKWTVETLLSKYDQIPKFKVQIGGRWSPFLFGNEVRNILWKPLLSLFGTMWWCWNGQRRFLKCSRTQGNNAPARVSSR